MRPSRGGGAVTVCPSRMSLGRALLHSCCSGDAKGGSKRHHPTRQDCGGLGRCRKERRRRIKVATSQAQRCTCQALRLVPAVLNELAAQHPHRSCMAHVPKPPLARQRPHSQSVVAFDTHHTHTAAFEPENGASPASHDRPGLIHSEYRFSSAGPLIAASACHYTVWNDWIVDNRWGRLILAGGAHSFHFSPM